MTLRREPGSLDEDVRTVHAIVEEAFADHWNHHDEPYGEWWPRRQQRSTAHPSAR